MEGRKINAALYIRVSTEDQTEFSPEAQKKALLAYAEKNGYDVAPEHIYIDCGISGRKAEKRPKFMEMVSAAGKKPRPFDVILVHKFDRFARSREDSVIYKAMLRKKCGVKVISITESIDDSKFSIILESILEAMGEYYSINLGEEVKKGMTEKARRGGLQTAPPFGYCVLGNCLVPVSPEAEIVRQIFSKFLSGSSVLSITKWLNSLGVKTKKGNKFDCRGVAYIIQNPVYAGMLRWNPSGKTGRNFTQDGIIVAPGKHRPIISREMWEKASEKLASQKKSEVLSKGSGRIADWPSGIVTCAACGRKLVHSKPGYYRCSGYIKGQCTCSQHIGADKLKRSIIARLKADLKPGCALGYKLLSPQNEGEAAIIKSRIEIETLKISRLKEAYLTGTIELDDFTREKEVISDTISELRVRLASLPQEESSPSPLIMAIEEAAANFCPENLDTASINLAMRSIIKSCSFNKDENTIIIEYNL